MLTQANTPRHKSILIDARHGSLDLAEMWEFRELLAALVIRDLHVRYRQSVLGVSWVVLQPVVVVIVTTLAFGRVAHFSSDNVPYPLFALAALVPWNYFARSLTLLAECLVGQRGVLTKIYFPRLILPLASVLSGLVDCIIGFGLLTGLMAYYHQPFVATMLYLPLLVLFLLLSALGVGLWLAPLNALYRDFQAVLPFILQVGLFATPIVYSTSMIPERWWLLYRLNPLVFVIDMVRSTFFGLPAPSMGETALAFGVVFTLVSSGVVFFLRVENNFVDLL